MYAFLLYSNFQRYHVSKINTLKSCKKEVFVNSAAMNGYTCILELWLSQGLCPVIKFLGHMVDLFLGFIFYLYLYIFSSGMKL